VLNDAMVVSGDLDGLLGTLLGIGLGNRGDKVVLISGGGAKQLGLPARYEEAALISSGAIGPGLRDRYDEVVLISGGTGILGAGLRDRLDEEGLISG
jgi:hypothetical protein